MYAYLKKWKKYFVFIGLFSCFINILQLTFVFYMFTIYRSIVASYSQTSLYSITMIALFAFVILGLFNYLRTKILSVAGIDLNRHFGGAIFKTMLKLNAYPVKGYSQGLNDLTTLNIFFNSPGVYAIFDIPWSPFYLLLIFFIHSTLGFIALMGAIVIFSLSIFQNFLTHQRIARANSIYGQNIIEVNGYLRNAELINSMGMESNVCRRWEGKNKQLISDQTIASRYAGILQNIVKPLQIFMQVLMYGVGAYYALRGELDIGLMVAASIIMGQALGPVMRIMASWNFMLKAKSSYARLFQFIYIIENQKKKMRLLVPRGELSVQNLFFKIDEKLLLNNISFSLSPGEILGVIGPSGAGKTTLCRVLVGIWPALRGKVRLDGVDLFYWDHDEIGKNIGYLPQNIELLKVSVAANIARMGEIDEATLKKAAETVKMHEFIENLPKGYHTPLYGENGFFLSGGQKQRIALARACYGNPRLLVLDEPNSNLDELGEKALSDMLTMMKQNRETTCIIVTHKLEILNSVDKILTLQDGKVVQFGDKNEILNQRHKIQPVAQKATY